MEKAKTKPGIDYVLITIILLYGITFILHAISTI